MVAHREHQISDESRHRIEDTATLCDMLMASVDSKSLAIGRGMAVRPVPVLLNRDVIMPVARMLELSFKRREIRLVVSEAVRRSPRVFADPHLLRLVVYNLLDNALKYSEHKTEVTIDGHERQNSYEVIISSYGPQISEKERDKIFSIGYRSPNAIGRNVSGQGVGLYTCRLIMRRLGGDVLLTNHGDPVSFSITLQLYVDQNGGLQ